MKKSLSSNFRSLTRNQLSKISGGHDLTVYDPDNPCQNWTEVVPFGCSCSGGGQCPTTYVTIKGKTNSRVGVCSNGYCN